MCIRKHLIYYTKKMRENPRVSVVAASYNEERNIARFLKSIASQTYKNTEAIIVDDGSTDKTVEIAKKFCKKVYARSHAERSVQRNFGVSMAEGKYVLVLDPDMELSSGAIEDCVATAERDGFKALVVPEKTVGQSFMAKVRSFERSMYMGDPTIEVARFFDKKVFEEFSGYDTTLTGTEDYDLPKRISQKYLIGRSHEYILHHEEQLTLIRQLRKKFYYAQKSATYADKHPDMVFKQGILVLRGAYLRHWTNFIKHPVLGVTLLFVRSLESVSAILGFISAVGVIKFSQVFLRMFKEA